MTEQDGRTVQDGSEPPENSIYLTLPLTPLHTKTILNCPSVLWRKQPTEERHRGSAVSMNISHLETPLMVGGEPWQPVHPPKRGEDRTAFNAFMLLPGLSLSFYAAVLGRSRPSVSTYMAAAREAARSDGAIMAAVDAAVCAMRPEHGLQMARVRGKAQLPYWSRLAIGEYRKRGFNRREIATAFRCSPGTVANVLQGKGRGYKALSGERRLTNAQAHPPGRWSRSASTSAETRCRSGHEIPPVPLQTG